MPAIDAGSRLAIVMISVIDGPVPVAFLALTDTTVTPAVVGTPAMTPVVVLIARPAGNAPTLKLVGALFAVTV